MKLKHFLKNLVQCITCILLSIVSGGDGSSQRPQITSGKKWEPRSTQPIRSKTDISIYPTRLCNNFFILVFWNRGFELWALYKLGKHFATEYTSVPGVYAPGHRLCPQETFSSPVSFGVVLKIILCLCQPHPEGPCYLGVRIVFKKIWLPFIWRSACLKLLLSSLDR